VGGPGPRPNVRNFHLLYAGAVRVRRTLELDEVVSALEYDLGLYVAEAARQLIFVHAGAVGWGGQGILIPGPTRSGKTSLVAALVRAGAVYYSDEYALLDRRGWLHPYPRPLSVRGPGSESPRLTPVEALGGRAGEQPLPVRLVLATHYQSGAAWRPPHLTPGQGALALLQNAVSARLHAPTVLARLQQVVTRAPALGGARGDAEELIAALPRYWKHARAPAEREDLLRQG